MKKIISLLLVLALCCAGAGAALAEAAPAEEDENTIILCNGGITVTVPESMRNLKGMLQASETGELVPGSGLFGGSIFYLMKTEEEMADLQERYMQIIAEAGDELTEEQQNQINELLSEYSAAYAPLFEFLTVSGGKTLEEGVGSLIGEETLAMYDIRLLGTVGEYSHYLLQLKPDSEVASSTAIPDELKDEYAAVLGGKDDLIAALTLGEPEAVEEPHYDAVAALDFEAWDLDGNPVDLKEVFAQHKVTMVNFWGTFCGPCKAEFPELEEMNNGELAEKDCVIIGICTDINEKTTDKAKDVLAQCGVTYLNLYTTKEALAALQLEGVPTSFFVNSEGQFATEPVIGAYVDMYRTRFEEALNAAK